MLFGPCRIWDWRSGSRGGTSLSKGFGLIQRFSEDLDLKLEGGKLELPSVRNWKSKERGPLAERLAFFKAVAAFSLVDLQLRLDPASLGERCTNAGIEARYPGHFSAGLPQAMRPFVLLEVGDARIRPFVERPVSSWVHDHHLPGLDDTAARLVSEMLTQHQVRQTSFGDGSGLPSRWWRVLGFDQVGLPGDCPYVLGKTDGA